MDSSNFEFLFAVLCFVILGGIGYSIFSGILRWAEDNEKPVLTLPAHVIAKRTLVSGHENVSTSYYATFEFESGERVELKMKGNEYGVLMEGDNGALTYQGSRYLGFERQIAPRTPVQS